MFGSEEDTVDTRGSSHGQKNLFADPHPPWDVVLGGATHRGKVRETNEDHFAIVRRTRSREVLLTNLPHEELHCQDDHAYALVVADGIGGAAFGDFASRLALATVFELAGRATSWVMKLTELKAEQVRQRIDAYVDQIQAALRSYSLSDSRFAGMGTTWTSAYLMPPHAIFVHIGDSRGYVLRDGELHQVTRDQTLAQDMLDAGQDPQSVRRFAHLLTNSLGGNKEHVKAEIYHVRLESGDRLLLCTDGLPDMVEESEIVRLLEQFPVAQEAVDHLVQAALDGGGRDNITVLVCDVLESAS